jgi:hypothetical protein
VRKVERAVRIARRTLQKARFFPGLAEQAGVADWDAFVFCFEAAIVFGRSIPNHLQKQYTRRDDVWCKNRIKATLLEPLVKFFVETRDFILKEGEVSIRRAFSIEIGVCAIAVGGTAITMKVIRAAPWYKRSLRILWQDSARAFLRPWREWREAGREKQRIEVLRREAEAASEAPSTTKVHFYFVTENPVAKDRSVVELAYEYLRRMEAEIDTFEARFGIS